MTPAARVQAAIEVLEHWRGGDEGLDRVLASWGRAHRFAGSGDRRAIADLVHDAVRRLRSAGWVAGADEPVSGRAALIGSLLLDGADPASLFTGAGYAPPPLTAEETARLGRPLDQAPRPVRLDFPDWLEPHLAPVPDAVPDAALDLMRQRAPAFVRVNLLRATPEEAIGALAADGIGAEPGPLSPNCLKIVAGARHLRRSRAFSEGLVEIQDAASQAAADYARAAPGETVLDYCAGAGGKTLALAAALQGAGQLHAHDIAPERLERLVERAERAGARVTLHQPGELQDLEAACDLVFVDAPCSGSGTWRRQPGAKWRLTPAGLAAETERQDAILAGAAAAVRPGGRLVYATCSLLGVENEDRIARFLAAQPGFREDRAPLRLTPLDGGDAFFACQLRRAPCCSGG